MERFKIGFIDEDKLEWEKVERGLRDFFDVIEYDIPQGLSKEALIEQVYTSDIDLLMVDFLMCDRGYLNFNGDEFVRDFEKIKPKFPMIIFTTHETDAFPQVDNPNIIYDKKLLNENKDRLVEIIIKNIELYKNYISERKIGINELLQKKTSEGLNSSEKNLLLEMQLELNILDKRANEVPLQLLEDNTFEKLASVTKEAEAFLASLINSKNDDTIKR
jgi:hypothetical protein